MIQPTLHRLDSGAPARASSQDWPGLLRSWNTRLAAGLLSLLAGCYGMGDYRAAEQGKVAVDPRSLQVDSAKYPRFRLAQNLAPPPIRTLPSEEDFLAQREREREEARRRGWRPARSLPALDDKQAWQKLYRAEYQRQKTNVQPVEILSSDEWYVSHVVGDFYLIHSPSFQDRQCRSIAARAIDGRLDVMGIDRRTFPEKCIYEYTYHIPIRPDGTVVGGWKLIRDNTFEFNRRTILEIDPGAAKAWGVQPIFKKVHSNH
jgi:hypothetical protein